MIVNHDKNVIKLNTFTGQNWRIDGYGKEWQFLPEKNQAMPKTEEVKVLT